MTRSMVTILPEVRAACSRGLYRRSGPVPRSRGLCSRWEEVAAEFVLRPRVGDSVEEYTAPLPRRHARSKTTMLEATTPPVRPSMGRKDRPYPVYMQSMFRRRRETSAPTTDRHRLTLCPQLQRNVRRERPMPRRDFAGWMLLRRALFLF